MINVVVWGAGMMGQGLLHYILDRPNDVELVGVIDRDPAKHDVEISALLGRPHDARLTADVDAILAKKPDVVCICTQSFLHEITDQVSAAVRAGCNVICSAEELAYPWARDPKWADEIDALAKHHGVSVLGAGINPGFVLDALIVAWSSMCLRIDRIEAARINDLSPFGPTVMKSQGVGTSVEEFERGVADGTIVGHIGFPESIHLIASAMGWEIDRIEETREPIVSSVDRATPHVTVKAGDVAGCRQVGRGYVGDELKIELVHPQQIHPEVEGVSTGDYLHIIGDPEIHMSTSPEVPGGKGTYASMGNYLPLIVDAPSGIVTVVDLPIPRYWAPAQ